MFIVRDSNPDYRLPKAQEQSDDLIGWLDGAEDKNRDIFERELVTKLVTELACYRVRVELFRSVLLCI